MNVRIKNMSGKILKDFICLKRKSIVFFKKYRVRIRDGFGICFGKEVGLK